MDESATRYALTAGAEFTRGKYGDTKSTDITYVPVTGKVSMGRLGLKLTVPWIEIHGPSVVLIDAGPVGAGSGTVTTESGLGDVVAAATFSAIEASSLGFFLDLTGKVKFGTASKQRGLGTEERDYTVLADAFQTFGNFSVLASAGYRWYGDPPEGKFNNVRLGSLGAAYKFSDEWNAGLILDYREKATRSGFIMREYTGYVTHRLDRGTKLQVYGIGGTSDGSPDWGLGTTVTREF